MNINFQNINVIVGNSRNDSFEELCCQLFLQQYPSAKRRDGSGGDGGLEIYCDKDSSNIVGLQAKYFIDKFGKTQLDQIESSFNSVINSQINLNTMILCLSRNLTQAQRTKLDEIIKDKPFKVELWDESKIISLMIGNESLLKLFFNERAINPSLLQSNFDKNRANISIKYRENINIKTEDSIKLNSFVSIDNDLTKIHKELYEICDNTDYFSRNAKDNISIVSLVDVRNKLNSLGVNLIPKDLYQDLLQVYNDLNNIHCNDGLDISAKNYFDYKKSKTIKSIEAILKTIDNRQKLWDSRFLMVCGEAGIGKTHLLYNTASECLQKRIPVLIFNAFNFVIGNESLLKQISNILETSEYYSGEEFLETFSVFCSIKNCNGVIIIDALNEAKDYKDLWKNRLPELNNSIKKLKNIKLIVSYRNNFFDNKSPMFDGYESISLEGFGSIEIEEFLKKNNIEHKLLSFNLYYNNPLFLIMLCEIVNSKGLKELPSNYYINEIFSDYLDKINKSCSESIHINYKDNIIKNCIKLIANKMSNLKKDYLDRETIQSICSSINHKVDIDILCIENVLDEIGDLSYYNLKNEDNKYYYKFTYHRFSDWLIVNELLQTKKDILSVCNNMMYYPFSWPEIMINYVPEKFNEEITTYNGNLQESIFYNLPYRNPKYVTDKTVFELEEYMSGEHYNYGVVFNALISHAMTDNPLNVEYLHNLLMKMSLPEREESWGNYLTKDYYEKGLDTELINKFVNWALSSYANEIEDLIYIKRSAIVLVWITASCDRKLRDDATKGLINLLENHLDLVLDIYNLFKTIDDKYILERLYCFIYGIAMRTKENFSEIALSVYSHFFNKDSIEVHVLIGYYAKHIVELALHKNFISSKDVDLEKLVSPYKSIFPTDFFEADPNDNYNQIVNKYYKEQEYNEFMDTLLKLDKNNLDDMRFKHQNYHLQGYRQILKSMGIESFKGYGDFGRYVFQARLTDICRDKIFLANAVNWCLNRIIEFGYNDALSEIDASYRKDCYYGRGGRDEPEVERIGKKYQKIAMYEVLALASDKYKIDSSQIDYLFRIDPSWLLELQEKQIKETYDNKLIASNFSWDNINFANWREWLKQTKDFPNIDLFIDQTHNNQDFICLNSIIDWKKYDDNVFVDDRNRKYFLASLMIKSFIIGDSNLDNSANFVGELVWKPMQIADYIEHEKETVFDFYLNSGGDVLMPIPELLSGLEWDKNSLNFTDDKNKTIIINTQDSIDIPNLILMDKNYLLEYLRQNKKELVFTVLLYKDYNEGININYEETVINEVFHYFKLDNKTGKIKKLSKKKAIHLW